MVKIANPQGPHYAVYLFCLAFFTFCRYNCTSAREKRDLNAAIAYMNRAIKIGECTRHESLADHLSFFAFCLQYRSIANGRTDDMKEAFATLQRSMYLRRPDDKIDVGKLQFTLFNWAVNLFVRVGDEDSLKRAITGLQREELRNEELDFELGGSDALSLAARALTTIVSPPSFERIAEALRTDPNSAGPDIFARRRALFSPILQGISLQLLPMQLYTDHRHWLPLVENYNGELDDDMMQWVDKGIYISKESIRLMAGMPEDMTKARFLLGMYLYYRYRLLGDNGNGLEALAILEETIQTPLNLLPEVKISAGHYSADIIFRLERWDEAHKLTRKTLGIYC